MLCNKKIVLKLNKYFELFNFIACERVDLKLSLEIRQKIEQGILLNKYSAIEHIIKMGYSRKYHYGDNLFLELNS